MRGGGRFIRQRRRGMTLTEVMVVLVIGLVLMGVLAPSVMGLFLLDQHQAAKELALLYEQLHDEAVMRNVTFRIEYDLQGGRYQVQVSESGALIFDDVDKREDYEDELESRKRGMTEEELAAFERTQARFSKLQARFKTDFALPSGTVFGGLYTPQYGEMIRRDDIDDEDPKLYSYIFPNGQAEHTVLWLVTEGDEDEGYTIEVEPLSGGVRLTGDLLEWDESSDYVPDEAPDLPGL